MDFASRFLGGYGQGRADKQQADAQAKQEKINMLLGQAYADPSQRDASLAQAAPLDFGAVVQAEQAFGSRDDRINKGRANLSRLYLATPAQGRARVLQQFGQDFQRLGLDPADPNFEQVATGYAQAFGPSGSELPSEIRTLQMLQANPDLLAVNDRFRGQKSFKEVTNPDGTVSYLALDSRTGTGGFAPIGGGGQQQSAPQGQPASMSPDQIIAAIATSAREMVAKGVPTDQIDGWVREQMRANAPKNVQTTDGPMVGQEATPLSQPAVNRPPTLDQIPLSQYGGGPVGGAGLGESNADRARAAAAQAAQVKAAEIAAQQAAAPRQAELDAQREAAITSARSGATNQAERDAVQRTNNTAFAQYTAARDTLLTDLAATSTGPIAGRLPAVTEGQQIAEGAQARMAPILKGLFRTAGEGTFTDKDQALLMAMVPTRTDLPGAVKAKMAGIDAIIEAKLQQGGGQSAQEDSPPVPGARKAPDGNWYVQQNGQTFKVEQ